MYNTGEIPSYPVIKGATWSPDIVRRLIDAAEKMGSDVMRWMYSSQNPEHNLLFGYKRADEVLKDIYSNYNAQLKENNAVDFDDLLLHPLKIFLVILGFLVFFWSIFIRNRNLE